MSDVEAEHDAPIGPPRQSEPEASLRAEASQQDSYGDMIAMPMVYAVGDDSGTGVASDGGDDLMDDVEHDGSGPPFYMTLGVPVDATVDEIRRAYYRQARLWHPDKNSNRLTEATEQFKLVVEAFETLSDAGKRAEYDFEMSVTAAPEQNDYPADLFLPTRTTTCRLLRATMTSWTQGKRQALTMWGSPRRKTRSGMAAAILTRSGQTYIIIVTFVTMGTAVSGHT